MKFSDDSILALGVGIAFAVAAVCFWFALGWLLTPFFSGPWTN